SAELPNVVNNRPKQGLRRQFTMLSQRLEQALFSKFLSSVVERFGDAVGVERDRISREELAFPDRAIPFLEESEHRARGFEPFQRVIAPKEKGGEMPAARVAQAPRAVVILGEEEGGVGVVGGILVEELVHRAQEALRVIASARALAAQVRLQIGHQQSGGDSLP